MSQLPDDPSTTQAAAPRTPDAPPDAQVVDLLRGVRKIAVIGASTRDGRPANYVPAYLAHQGYDVVGVNPVSAGESLFGNEVVSTLAAVDGPVDLVNVFRRNEDIPGHLDELLALDPLPSVVWIQKGLRHDATAEALRAKGVTVVQDRCLMVEHRRLVGQATAE